MKKLPFFISCFCVLVLSDAFDEFQKIKFGIIIETCFNKTEEFENKLSKITAINASVSAAIFDVQCGDIVAARKQVCSLIKIDKFNAFAAVATNHLVDFYEMMFNTLRSSRTINNDLRTIINDIADVFDWTNIFIYADKNYDSVMPSCSKVFKSCRSVMVWTNEESPKDFIHQTLYFKDGAKIVRTETNYYVLILPAEETMEVIKIAKEKGLFNFYTEWLVFATTETEDLILTSLRGLKYNSNVYIAELRSKEAPVTDVLNLLAIQNEWKDNYRSTHGSIQTNRIKYICGDDKTISIDADIPRITSELQLLEVIPTRFDANPSLHVLGNWSMNANPRYNSLNERKIPDFEGVKLNVSTLQTPPYVIIKKSNSSTHFSGYLVDLLNIAAEKLNFTYEIFAVEDDEYGKKTCYANGTCQWSGIIGAIKRGDAQIALANLTPLPMRAKEILFLHTALATGGFKMIYSKPNIYDQSSVLRAYIRPFHYQTWICVVLLVLVLVLLLTVNQRIKNFQRARKWGNTNKTSKNFKIDDPVFVAVQVFCLQGLQDTPKDGSSRIVFIVMWLFSLLVYSSYAATLTSFFTTTELKLPIKNLDDFLKQTEYKMAFKAGSAYVAMMGEKYIQEEFRRLNERLLKDGNTSYVSSINEGLERIEKEKLIFAHDQGTIKWAASMSCNLIVVGPAYMKIGVTIATNLNSEYYRGLDWVLRMSMEGGLAQRSEKEHWVKKAVECDLKSNNFRSVSILTVCAPLLILGVGLCSGLLVVPFEGFYNWIFKGYCKPPITYRKRHLVAVEAPKNFFYGYRTFSQRKGLRKRIVSRRRSPGAISLYF